MNLEGAVLSFVRLFLKCACKLFSCGDLSKYTILYGFLDRTHHHSHKYASIGNPAISRRSINFFEPGIFGCWCHPSANELAVQRERVCRMVPKIIVHGEGTKDERKEREDI